MCKEYHRTHKSVLPPSSLTVKDNDLIIPVAREQHPPYHVIVLKCALHTLRFISATPKNTKINMKVLTPNINKWFLQLNKD